MPKLLLLTRRTLCTLYYALKQYQQLAKRDHSSILTQNDRNWYPVLDISTFKLPSYCSLHVEHRARCTKRRNKPSHKQNAINRRYSREMTTNAFPLEIFRRLNAHTTAFYAHNMVHVVLSVETSPATSKTRSIVDIHEK
jgi:uncharacterized protein YbcV (DUF1398 family)